ncbi:unnamed protein product [Soboliphyme baturini]|uniref:PAZ domain-containing protein n=1 Tax=Soboliphyme baturini TaxID=241478 RepID=A0A183IUC0_9BILA|nr:unnamed protein product [Soboliphyme baturini]
MSNSEYFEEQIPGQPIINNSQMALAGARPQGTLGTPITMLTNHFLMTIPPDLVVFHYDVEVNFARGKIRESLTDRGTECRQRRMHDRLESREECFVLYKGLYAKYPKIFSSDRRFEIFYDGRKNLFSLSQLDISKAHPFTAMFRKPNGDEATFKVTPCDPLTVNASDIISGFAGNFIDFDRSALQVLDVITSMKLNLNLGKEEYMQFGPFYFTSLITQPFGAGMQIYDGLFKSIRPLTGSSAIAERYVLTLNIDTRKAPFFAAQDMLTTICEVLKLSAVPTGPLASYQLQILNHFLKGLKVKALHTKQAFKITGISPKTSNTYEFAVDDEHRVTVTNYFKEKYNIKLKFVNLPVVLKGRSAFPMEVLQIRPYQKIALSRLTVEDQAAFIRANSLVPYDRMQAIMRKLYIEESHNLDAPFSVDIDRRPFGSVALRAEDVMGIMQ